MHTYSAKVIDKIENPPRDGQRTWHSIKVGVFRAEEGKEEQVGEYIRNYTTLFSTFCYFRQGDKEYALYSPNYTATRVMELPSCKDLGGEEPNAAGFCPTDFYVPSYIDFENVYPDDRIERRRINNPSPENLLPKMVKYYPFDKQTGKAQEVEKPSYPVSPHLYYPFGFVAGCVWGDDISWKVQHLDLSEVNRGIIKRDDRFGYIELLDNMNLREAINMSEYLFYPDANDPYRHITITAKQKFNLLTGKRLDGPD